MSYYLAILMSLVLLFGALAVGGRERVVDVALMTAIAFALYAIALSMHHEDFN